MSTYNCQHIGKPTGTTQTDFGMQPEFACSHPHRRATQQLTTLPRCMTCADYLPRHDLASPTASPPTQATPSECRHPRGVIVDRWGVDAGIADLYMGCAAFLVLGGPSTRKQDLSVLAARGCLIMSVNNSPAVLPTEPFPIRPHVWTHTDPTGKFCWDIWADPGVLKLTPVKEWKSKRKPHKKKGIFYRDKSSGELEQIPGQTAWGMPGILGFHRNAEFRPDDWLFEGTVNRGNDIQHATGEKKGKKVGEPNGHPHCINTMFAAVRLAFYLGIKTLYLIGADFNMDANNPYGFSQAKSAGGVGGNNKSYASMNVMFNSLKPHFDSAGFTVINCTPNSGLYVFDSMVLNDAVDLVTNDFEQEMKTDGWYNKGEEAVAK